MVEVELRTERPGDADAIRDVHRRAFQRDDEGRLVAALRSQGLVAVSLVAERDGKVIGHVLFSDLTIETSQGAVPALALAPVAVLPEAQSQGVGSRLIHAALDRCRELGHTTVFVLGEPGYYRRFGFSAELAAPLDSPYRGPYFMALELVPGALSGLKGSSVVYPPPFRGL